jgi:hypothetical protein
MSMSERADVLDEHKRLVDKNDRAHVALEATLAAIRRAGKRSGASMATMESQLARRTISAVTFFWNYNTVESVLLFCAVLVNLAGVMFESGQLDQNGFEAQKAFITWVVVIIIVLSILYFFVVLFSEIYLMCTANSKRNQAKALAAAKKQAELNRRKQQPVTGQASFDARAESAAQNPLFAVRVLGSDGDFDDGTSLEALLTLKDAPTIGQWNAVVVGTKNLLEANREFAASTAKLKQEVQQLRAIVSSTASSSQASRLKPRNTSAAASGGGGLPRRASVSRKRMDSGSLSSMSTDNPLHGDTAFTITY